MKLCTGGVGGGRGGKNCTLLHDGCHGEPDGVAEGELGVVTEGVHISILHTMSMSMTMAMSIIVSPSGVGTDSSHQEHHTTSNEDCAYVVKSKRGIFDLQLHFQ